MNHVIMTKVNVVQEMLSQTQEELDGVLPSMLRPQEGKFKGES